MTETDELDWLYRQRRQRVRIEMSVLKMQFCWIKTGHRRRTTISHVPGAGYCRCVGSAMWGHLYGR